MHRPVLITLAILFFACIAFARKEEPVTLKTATGAISGTLTLPLKFTRGPVVLIIAGSGPTDRNGNNKLVQNNSLLSLADSLARHGIASVRYDKRGIEKSKAAAPDEAALRFDHYISDVTAWVMLLRKDKRFTQCFILGHSEGSLIGMMAAKQVPVDGFISASGAGAPADVIMMQQFAASPNIPKERLDSISRYFTLLKQTGKIADTIPPGFFQAYFRPTVQPYLASWFKYDPAEEIRTLQVPTLIIQGTTDLQVDTTQALRLASARHNMKLVIIPGMNHIFKAAEPGDLAANSASYYDADSPIMSEMVRAVVAFIRDTKKWK